MNRLPEPRRRRLVLATLGASASALALRAFGADMARGAQPVEFGVVPYLPTARLLSVFGPLRARFEMAFQRRVILSTAPDFKSFQRRALEGAYDLYFIGPGPGWQVFRDRGHLVIAAAKAILRIFLLVAKDGPIREIGDLHGRTLATIDPLTVTAQVAATELLKNGLRPGIEVFLRNEKNPFNAAWAVILGEAAAAACPDVAYPSFPDELRDKLQILHRSEALPSGLLMMNPAAGLPPLKEIRKIVFEFDASPAGQRFGKESGQEGFSLPDMEALAILDRFVPEVRRVMSQP